MNSAPNFWCYNHNLAKKENHSLALKFSERIFTNNVLLSFSFWNRWRVP